MKSSISLQRSATGKSPLVNVLNTFRLVQSALLTSKDPRVLGAAESVLSALLPHLKKRTCALPEELLRHYNLLTERKEP